MVRRRRAFLVLSILSLMVAGPFGRAADKATNIDFSRQIRPLLADNCFACHGPDDKARKAKLRLDTREGALAKKGVIVPGDAAKSELLVRLTSDEPGLHMPPARTGKTLKPEQIDLLKKWIDQGAKWADHWAFVSPTRPALPTLKRTEGARNPIDLFVRARLDKEGLVPSSEADRATLIRRLTLDLTGLPPTPEEVDTFLAESVAKPQAAYEELVDRLLASPRFGERLALEWLDAARFADTHGYHIDSGRDMTKWRDWVINAFNSNKPFDQFTIEQLAGDLLPNATVEQKIASGFHRNHMINFEGGAIPDEYHTAYIVDRVNTTGTVWLGMSVACAQCHDHKYDPLTQKEFYQLFAFFYNVPENGLDGSKGNAAPLLRMPTLEQQRDLDRLAAKVKDVEQRLPNLIKEIDAAQLDWEREVGIDLEAAELPAHVKTILEVPPGKRLPQQKTQLQDYYRAQFAPVIKQRQDQLAKLKKSHGDLDAAVPSAMVMQEMPSPRDTFLLVRGQYDKKGEKVKAATPAFLPPLPEDAPGNRLGLAQWLVSPDHPLTARVIVNRTWQMYFGTGLVKTVEDFGIQGERPSHPELLDWLATEFVSSGWDVKHLHRSIVTSATYRQSSVVTPALLAKDPENRLLARMTRLRLSAEHIRDQALAASGLLNGDIGGKSVFPYQPSGLWEELMSRADNDKWTAQKYVQSHGRDLYRRTMYTFWKRTSPPPTLATFDAPDRETCTVRRSRTNTPLQALILMNDPTYVEAARKLAERVMSGADSWEDRAALAFRLVTGRKPGDRELAILRRIYEEQKTIFSKDVDKALKLLSVGESKRNEKLDLAELAAWTSVASVILNLDEAVTRG